MLRPPRIHEVPLGVAFVPHATPVAVMAARHADDVPYEPAVTWTGAELAVRLGLRKEAA